PYTKTLQVEFHEGIKPWLFDLLKSRPKIMLGKMYWSITPVAYQQKTTEGGISIGFQEDAEYFGGIERYLLKFLQAVPAEVCGIEDTSSFKYVTLLFLLKEKHLTFVSVWNPTFFILLFKPLLEWSDSLIADIEHGTITTPSEIPSEVKNILRRKLSKDRVRAQELRSILKSYKNRALLYEQIWPMLSLISCWADASAASSAARLQELFPHTEIQPKGLLATEGMVSFPLVCKAAAALSIRSHFFEFIEKDTTQQKENHQRCATRLAHELELGKEYAVVITTGGGLYRYQLQDIVKVTGFIKKCPLIRFVGKEAHVSDLFGEKLNEYHVSVVAGKAFRKHSLAPSFLMVAAERNPQTQECFYTLFIELKNRKEVIILPSLAHDVEEGLKENYHYRYCRAIGQLAALQVFVITDDCAAETYMRVGKTLGQRLGNIKPLVLHTKMGWSKEFKGFFVDTETVLNKESCMIESS
ncbi:GH3 auxin-responsive promoter family protein, partial [Candidatus Omnitrophota bacterium]